MSWGILGNPTPEKISEWQNMPYGQFKNMVAGLKKKSKGKKLSRYKVRIRKTESEVRAAYHVVETFDSNLAVEEVKKLDESFFEWHEPTKIRDKYDYQVVLIE